MEKENNKSMSEHERISSENTDRGYWNYFCERCACDKNKIDCAGCRRTDAAPKNYTGVIE